MNKIKIAFIIDTLEAGGKARRFVEFLSYLKGTNKYEFKIILMKDEIHYKKFFDLQIEYEVIKRKKLKKDPTIFFKFYRALRTFKPHLIHTWGNMVTFYSLPYVILTRTPLINSQITNASTRIKKFSFANFVEKCNFIFSDIVTANSFAGLKSSGINSETKKYRVVYNGINLNRFLNLEDVQSVKEKYQIQTRFAVVMLASISPQKDTERFVRVANLVIKQRDDVTFLIAGKVFSQTKYNNVLNLIENRDRIKILGNVDDVESLLNACDLKILFTNDKEKFAEGISNAILEAMAAGKPVIANNTGGTPEIITHNFNGYVINNESDNEIALLISKILDNIDLIEFLSKNASETIKNKFSLDIMGDNFENLYSELIRKKPQKN